MSIILNDLQLDGGNYRVRRIAHDSAPPLELNSLTLTREDGAKLISFLYGAKQIRIEGIIKGTSLSDLQSNIDTLKKTISGVNLNLDIDYSGGTRRYNVNVVEIKIDTDFFHINFAPYEIVLLAQDPPFAFDTSITETLSIDNLTDTLTSYSVNFDGTAKPKPRIVFRIEDTGGGLLDTIRVKNIDTNTQLEVNTAFGDGQALEIDTEEKTVKLQQSDVGFSGVFPEFNLGSNNLELQFDAQNLIKISQTERNSYETFGGSSGYPDLALGQSFQYGSDITLEKVDILIRKTSNDTCSFYVKICNDNSGQPGTEIASVVLYSDGVPTSWGWVTVPFPSKPTLSANTTYWLVLHKCILCEGCADEPIYWGANVNNPYGNGNGAYLNYWESWLPLSNIDFCFRIYSSYSISWVVDINMDYQKRYL